MSCSTSDIAPLLLQRDKQFSSSSSICWFPFQIAQFCSKLRVIYFFVEAGIHFAFLFLVFIIFFLFIFEFILNLGQSSEAFLFKLLQFLNSGSDLLLSNNSIDQLVMLLRSVKSRKDLHHIEYLLFLLCPQLVQSHLFFQVQQFPLYDELFSSYSFAQLVIVDVNEPELHLFFFLAVIIIELHFGQEQLCVVVVLYLKIPPLRHKADDLGRIGPSL